MATLEQAFATIERAQFVPEDLRDQALLDMPLQIGFGQTISQPSTVEAMLEWLEPEEGDRVLDVGSGSGWTSALLGYLVGDEGKVCAVELISELVTFGKENCQKAGISNVVFFQAGSQYGLPEHAPYDRILVSAAADALPPDFLQQLKVGGKLVIPIGHDILEITKTSVDDSETLRHSGFAFVPLQKGK